ncbi:MAG TPA: hypothetical protein VJI69_09965 [Bacteroidia bacterium]|nr:hypothetical protein [Bacteroidia bacterium]
MRTIIFICLILIIGCNAPEQEDISNSKTKTVTEYFESGSKRSEKNYLNNIEEGPYKIWYQNGSIRSTGQYKNGELTGICTEYDTLGRRHREIVFIDDSIKQMITYHKNGVIAEVNTSNIKTRILIGKFVFFYNTGMPQIVADSWNGTWTEYHRNGRKKLEYDFTTPSTNENKKFWDENGKLIKEEFWENKKLLSTKEY